MWRANPLEGGGLDNIWAGGAETYRLLFHFTKIWPPWVHGLGSRTQIGQHHQTSAEHGSTFDH